MHRHYLFPAFAALALAACGSSDAEEAAPDATAAEEKAEPSEEAKAQNFQDTVEKAMADIPPQHRDSFQVAFECEIERNNASSEPQDIDATTIRKITADLKAGKKITC